MYSTLGTKVRGLDSGSGYMIFSHISGVRIQPHFIMRCHSIYIIFILLFNTTSLYEALFIKTFNHRLTKGGHKILVFLEFRSEAKQSYQSK